ncbi:hypothetical protein ACLX1H_002874 [Fusarium chlamydosporum]
MSSEIPADAEFGWQTLQSDIGKDYRVKASDYDIAELADMGDEAYPSGPPFKVDVNWHVGTEGAPSQEIQDITAITWYKFENAPWYSIYKYKLTITTRDTYKYTFIDNEPDIYSLNVFQTSGSHTIEFVSSSPTIASITGDY